jgi:protease IV
VAVRRGVWLVVALILVAGVISATGLIFTAMIVGREPQIAGNSALILKVSGDLQEVEASGVFGQLFEDAPTVRSVVEALRKAKTDKRVTGVVIRPTGTAALWGKVQEVRDAIVDFKSSGKPIVGFLEYGGEHRSSTSRAPATRSS